jgi:hypothetical protein
VTREVPHGVPPAPSPWWRALSPGAPLTSKAHLLLRLGLLGCFVGHGLWGFVPKVAWLPFFSQKPLLLEHLSALGLTLTPAQLQAFGLFEMGLGALVLLRPTPRLLGFVVGFKLASELLHPLAGSAIEWLETIERAGDYVLPIVFAMLIARTGARGLGARAGGHQDGRSRA